MNIENITILRSECRKAAKDLCINGLVNELCYLSSAISSIDTDNVDRIEMIALRVEVSNEIKRRNSEPSYISNRCNISIG